MTTRPECCAACGHPVADHVAAGRFLSCDHVREHAGEVTAIPSFATPTYTDVPDETVNTVRRRVAIELDGFLWAVWP